MNDIARILLGTTPGFEERRVLVFTPGPDFYLSDLLVNELPPVPPDKYHDPELYLRVEQDLEHSWYVVLQWDGESDTWYERYDPEHTEPENELNTDWYLHWRVRTCSIPASVLTVCP